MSSQSTTIPSSILIVGSGVFGLGTAYAITQRPDYKRTSITVIDRSPFPAPDASSIDSSRIVRADYADYAYSALCAQALELWRGEWGAEGRYSQSGLSILLDYDNLEDGPNGESKASMRNEMLANLCDLDKLGLKLGRKEDGGQVTVLENESDVRAIFSSAGGSPGHGGYVNWTSGWADAEAGMRYMRAKVEDTGRVTFRTAEISQLLFEHADAESSVSGVELVSGETLTADLTILATGAWTPKFIDLRGIASASGQVLTYLEITPEEQARLAKNPTMLNTSNGMFIIPPQSNVLKVARHGYGYANFKTIPHPEKPAGSGELITVSLPRTKQDDPNLQIAKEGFDACRDYLARCIPDLKDQPFTHTRICWYTDTPKGDWLIDYHPTHKGLFVVTGGSGHAYKFLPVIGDRIVDVLLDKPADALGEQLREKWRWPKEKYHQDHIWTTDWRGGKKGMVLDDELAVS